MMNLSNQPTPTLPVAAAAAGALAPASIYVADPALLAPQLPAGKHVVIAAAGGSAELTTSSTIGAAVTAAGTYVDAAQYVAIANWANPTLRLYTLTDTWRKMRSLPGILLLLSAFIGGVAAVAGLYFALVGTSPTQRVRGGRPRPDRARVDGRAS